MKRDVVIFGAGNWGKLAYYYYKDTCNVLCFIDNDKRIWGTSVLGIPVLSPDYLHEKSVPVVVANKRFQSEISNQLFSRYGISEVIIFEITEKVEQLYVNPPNYENNHELIIEFRDGLGNQMFQYALYKSMQAIGKNVKADISEYCKPWMMPYMLESVFSRVVLEKASPGMKDYYKNIGLVYNDLSSRKGEQYIYQESIYEMEKGCICGWHVSYKYAERIKKDLYELFKFDIDDYDDLQNVVANARQEKTVSVQVRRGDFLSPKWFRELGCHCTEDYYKKSIELIKKRIENPLFIFLSNDIEWVKQEFPLKNAIYVEENMFQQYYDWFDMCIMSNCKHNIIANSTFGWWGAWLNRNQDKIVIAPKYWRTNWNFQDFCPPEWIRI